MEETVQTEKQGGNTERPLAPDSLQISYKIKVTGAGHVPVDIDNVVDFPMLLHGESLSTAGTVFVECFKQLVTRPIQVGTNELFQKLLVEYRQQQAAKRTASAASGDGQKSFADLGKVC